MSKHLNLFVPEWQGYSLDNSPQIGALYLRDQLFRDLPFQEISIASTWDSEPQQSIHCYESVLQNMRQICEVIETADPETIFTLGGT